MDVTFLDATCLAAHIRAGELSPLEATTDAIARIESVNSELNMVISPRYEQAIVEASGDIADGPFQGVPILVKDLGAQQRGEPYFMGTQVLKDANHTADVDSHIVERLKRAGFIILGRTNTPEFGGTPHTEPRSFGASRNPWDVSRTPGGSSGGSAAAVAARCVAVAHASDGGGSIRIPASCCGIVGLKPTRGRISRGPHSGEGWGGFSTDGVVSVTVRDSAALLDVLEGPEPGDPYGVSRPNAPYTNAIEQQLPRLKIGVLADAPLGTPVSNDVKDAVADASTLLSNLGHDVSVGHPDALNDESFRDNYYSILACAMGRAVMVLEDTVGRTVDPHEVEPNIALLASLGAQISGAEYLAALDGIHQYNRRIAQYWTSVEHGGMGFDILVTPTVASPPPRVGSMVPTADHPMDALNKITDFVAFTPQFNATGQPALSVPLVWNGDNLPIGVQFVGAFGREDVLLQLATELERARPWIDRVPPLHSAV